MKLLFPKSRLILLARQGLQFLLLFILDFFLVGCITPVSLIYYNDISKKKEVPLILSGTRYCLDYYEAREKDPRSDPHGYIWMWGGGPPLLPFTLVEDLIVLPATIPWAIYESFSKDNQAPQSSNQQYQKSIKQIRFAIN